MNHIYKTVWNKALGNWVAVQETAKSKTKSSKAAVLIVFSLLLGGNAFALTGAARPAGAGDFHCFFHAASESVICGNGETSIVEKPAGKTAKSVAIGKKAITAGENSMALGVNSSASHASSLAIGAEAKAHHNQTIAIGRATHAFADSSVAVGDAAIAAGKETVSIGPKAGSRGVEAEAATSQIVPRTNIGKTSSLGLVHMTNVGYRSGADTINNNYGVNIGFEAGTGGYNSYYGEGVAIGNKAGSLNKADPFVANKMQEVSVAKGAQNNTIVTGNTNTAISTRAGINALGHDNVSIGKDAGGYTSGSSNVSIGKGAGRKQAKNGVGLYIDQVAGGSFGEANGTVSVGEWAHASAENSVAVGTEAKADGKFSIAMGLNAEVRKMGGVAVGNGSVSDGQDALAFGKASWAGKDYATALGNASHAGLEATAVGNGSKALGDYSTSFGTGSVASGPGAAALGNDSTASGWAAVASGRGSIAGGSSTVAIGEGANASHDNSVAVGKDSRTSVVDNTSRNLATVGGLQYSGFAGVNPTSMVSFGRVSDISDPLNPVTSIERVVTNVAAGKISATSTDAINGSQLYATQGVIGKIGQSVVAVLGDGASISGEGIISAGNNIGGTGKSTIHEAIQHVAAASGSSTWEIGNGQAASVGNVSNGERVDFIAGNANTKVEVTDAGSKSVVKISSSPNSLAYTDTNKPEGGNAVSSDQFDPRDQVTLLAPAANTTGVTINNVAAGTLSAVSKQAVNGSQLFALGSSLVTAFGGTSAFNPATGVFTSGLEVGGATYSNIQDALRAVNATASGGWGLQANSGTVSHVSGATNTVNVINGSNTQAVLSGHNLQINVVDSPSFVGNVSANGGLNVAGNLTLAANTNVNAGGNVIKNVADGVADTDAVNVRQMRSMSGNLAHITNQANNIDARVTQVDQRVTNLSTQIAGFTGKVAETEKRVKDVADLVGNNVQSDGSKGLNMYDVTGQTKTEHASVISAIHQMKNEGTKYSHTRDNGEAPVLGPTNASSAAALASSAVGVNAVVEEQAESGLAVGHKSRVTQRAKKALAVGHRALSAGESSVAIGDGSQALGDRSLSIGFGNMVYAHRSGAIGDPTTIVASATDSYSLGNNNVVNTADTFVIGNNVVTAVANSVYLGAGAAARAEPSATTAGLATYNQQLVDGEVHEYAGGTPVGIVSVGAPGQERRIQNVASGLVAPGSTDAINGSQLHQTNQAIMGLRNDIRMNHDKAMSGVASAMASAGLPQAYMPGKNMVALGFGAYKGRTALAIGVSTISDNGKWTVKGSINANNDGSIGGTLGAGYQW